MLLTPNFLDYDNLIIFTKSSFQPEYQLLSQGFHAGLQKEDIISLFKLQNNRNDYNIEDIVANSGPSGVRSATWLGLRPRRPPERTIQS